MLQTEAVKEFQEIYKQTYGKEISFEVAKIKAEEFMQLFNAIHKPIRKIWTSKHE